MKRQCVVQAGVSASTRVFQAIAFDWRDMGWLHGWYFPFLYQEHMDDPRTEHTLLKSDMDLEKYMPLSAQNFGATTLVQWRDQLRRSAENGSRSPGGPKDLLAVCESCCVGSCMDRLPGSAVWLVPRW